MLLLEGVGVLEVVARVTFVEAQAHHLVPQDNNIFKGSYFITSISYLGWLPNLLVLT